MDKNPTVPKIKIIIKPKKVAMHVQVPKYGHFCESKSKKTITITYGECAENHVGMQQIGTKGKHGLTLEELKVADEYFQALGYETELIMLAEQGLTDIDDKTLITKEIQDACILVVRKGVEALTNENTTIDDLYKEQSKLDHDTRAKMYGRIVNKKARYNLCFDDEEQEPDYETGKGRVISFKSVPITDMIRNTIAELFPDNASVKTLKAEGNYYFNTQCGIGYHGDAERKVVIAARLGDSMPLQYCWYYWGSRMGTPIKLVLNHGDMYFMSDKATGSDWKTKKKLTLRHAAGEKFI